MNKLDKILAAVAPIEKGRQNPYEDKESWNWFDYLMGYGCPLMILFGVGLMIFSGFR